MERKLILIPLLFIAIEMMAETSLIVQPLSGQEQENALSQIGYVKVTQDSLFIFSKGDFLLSKIAINNVHHIRYSETDEGTGIDEVLTEADCRVYPNPTIDNLVIEHANCEKAYIFDLNGNLMLAAPVNSEHTLVNVANLPLGEYVLLLNNQTFKFIKQ